MIPHPPLLPSLTIGGTRPLEKPSSLYMLSLGSSITSVVAASPPPSLVSPQDFLLSLLSLEHQIFILF